MAVKQYKVLLWGHNVPALEIGLNQLAQREGWELHSVVGPRVVLVREFDSAAESAPQPPLQQAIAATRDAAAFDPSKPTEDPQPIPGDQPNARIEH